MINLKESELLKEIIENYMENNIEWVMENEKEIIENLNLKLNLDLDFSVLN